jgi:1,4-dihydroxy-2-naphthoyl-CoA hydrolase
MIDVPQLTEQEKLLKINQLIKGTLMETLGIQFTEIKEKYISGTMPVDHRTIQPAGVVHGGAYMALAETLGSAASMLSVDPQLYRVLGLEMKGNYLRTVSSGKVHGKATPVHKGKTTQLWNIDMWDDEGNLLATCRITNIIMKKE